MAEDFRLEPEGPFELATSKRFLEGFTPTGQPETDDDHLILAVLTDDWRAAAVRLWQTPERVLGEVVDGDADHGVVRGQVERVLSLDVDGSGFEALAEDDEVLAGLMTLFRGLRPVLFPTPYEAACWSVLSQRTRMTQAAHVRARLVEAHGTTLRVGAATRHAFPAPQALLRVTELDGVGDEKLARLHAVATAADEGALDAAALRALTVDEALAALRRIHGIGPFGAELVLVRGAGAPDVYPSRERRLHQAMAELYELDDPDEGELERIADGWRPYRSWVALLLRAWWEEHRR